MFATSLADTCPIFEGSVVNKLQQFLRTWFHIRGISSTSILIMVYLGAAISKNSRFGTFRIEDSSNNPVSRRGNDSTNDGFPILSMLSKYLNGMNMSWFLEKIRVVLYRILVQKRGDFRDSVCWCGHCWRHCWRHCWPHISQGVEQRAGFLLYFQDHQWCWGGSFDSEPHRVCPGERGLNGTIGAPRCPLSHIYWALNIIDRVSMSYVSMSSAP